jgi:hypothetical protein
MNPGKIFFLTTAQKYSMSFRKMKVGMNLMLITTASVPQNIIN